MNIVLYTYSNTANSYRNYDNSVLVEGEIAGDMKWCGIDLIQMYVTVSVNSLNSVNSATIENAASLSGIDDLNEVSRIELKKGLVTEVILKEIREKFTELTTLVIDSNALMQSTVLTSDLPWFCFERMTSSKLLLRIMFHSFVFATSS